MDRMESFYRTATRQATGFIEKNAGPLLGVSIVPVLLVAFVYFVFDGRLVDQYYPATLHEFLSRSILLVYIKTCFYFIFIILISVITIRLFYEFEKDFTLLSAVAWKSHHTRFLMRSMALAAMLLAATYLLASFTAIISISLRPGQDSAAYIKYSLSFIEYIIRFLLMTLVYSLLTAAFVPFIFQELVETEEVGAERIWSGHRAGIPLFWIAFTAYTGLELVDLATGLMKPGGLVDLGLLQMILAEVLRFAAHAVVIMFGAAAMAFTFEHLVLPEPEEESVDDA